MLCTREPVQQHQLDGYCYANFRPKLEAIVL